MSEEKIPRRVRRIMEESGLDEIEARFVDALERGEITGCVQTLTEAEEAELRREFPEAFADLDRRMAARASGKPLPEPGFTRPG